MGRTDAARTAYPDSIEEAERGQVKERRCRAGEEDPDARPWLGFALSGGGIRSATFCLGLFQALARHRLLRRIDLLSTVSGGGYFGSFLGTLYRREFVGKPEDAEGALDGSSPETGGRIVDTLRENGRYLTPNGGDLTLAIATFLRNLAAVHVVVLMPVLALFLLVRTADRALLAGGFAPYRTLVEALLPFAPDGVRWSPLVVPSVALLALAVVPLGWAYWTVGREERRGPLVAVWVAWFAGMAPLLVKIASLAWPGRLPSVEWETAGLWIDLSAVAGATLLWRAVALRKVGPSFLVGRGAKGRGIGERVRDRFQQVNALFLRTPTWGAEGGGWDRRVRDWLSRGMAFWLALDAVLLAAAIVDTASISIHARIAHDGFRVLGPWISSVAVGVAGAAAVVRNVMGSLGAEDAEGRTTKVPVTLLLGAGVVPLVLVLLLTVGVFACGLSWGFHEPRGLPPGLHPAAGADVRWEDVVPALAAFVGASLLALLVGRTTAFLNRSSHHTLYSVRLTRAYLGSSNRLRWEDGVGVSALLGDDDIRLKDYWRDPVPAGAPLHVFNVTINETLVTRLDPNRGETGPSGRPAMEGGDSSVQQRDRKGLGLAIGPAGMSAGARHHIAIRWADMPEEEGFTTGSMPDWPVQPDPGVTRFRVFGGGLARPPEDLSLGQWVGISGAAFSTGLGSRTSPSLSLLCGLANVRLGYWWEPNVKWEVGHGGAPGSGGWTAKRGWLDRTVKNVLPMQWYLFAEFLARFPGTLSKRWYLSDGGHFENLGGYELVRRRVPCMVVVDAGCDPDSGLEDLANLVRKARLDFGAEIRFLDEEELGKDRPEFLGPLPSLARGTWSRETGGVWHMESASREGLSRAHAALARVTYEDSPDAPECWLLYVKPTLVGEEAEDVAQYHVAHPDFPHESTKDQFFAEEQWESYRKLGETIGLRLFGPGAAGGKGPWTPHAFVLRGQAPR